MTIEEKRRELFESWYSKREGGFMPSFFDGEYDWADAQPCWLAFNAALDSLCIELPDCTEFDSPSGAAPAIAECRAAIESTGLGLKVLP